MNFILNSNWTIAKASVLGNGHQSSGTPCQDAYYHQEINQDWGIVVVCDGAGSYKDSQIGSKWVSQRVAEKLLDLDTEKEWSAQSSLPKEEDWKQFAQQMLRETRDELQDYAEKEQLDFEQLGCTVIALLYSPIGLFITHIGDGRGAYSLDGKTWESLFTPFEGERAGSTVFITLDIWEEPELSRFVETKVINESVESFTIMSDGCEYAAFNCYQIDDSGLMEKKNAAEPSFFNPNVEKLKSLHQQRFTKDQINARWTQFIEIGNEVLKAEQDDKTIILGTRISQ